MRAIWMKRDDRYSISEEQRSLRTHLSQYALFEGLDTDQLARLVPAVRMKEFREEEIVCHCPDAFHEAFLLLKGVVGVTRKKGEDLRVVQLAKMGAVFNVGPLFSLGHDQAGVRALGSVEIIALDNGKLIQMLQKDPRLGYAFVRNLGRLALDQYEQQLDRCVG